MFLIFHLIFFVKHKNNDNKWLKIAQNIIFDNFVIQKDKIWLIFWKRFILNANEISTWLHCTILSQTKRIWDSICHVSWFYLEERQTDGR